MPSPASELPKLYSPEDLVGIYGSHVLSAWGIEEAVRAGARHMRGAGSSVWFTAKQVDLLFEAMSVERPTRGSRRRKRAEQTAAADAA